VSVTVVRGHGGRGVHAVPSSAVVQSRGVGVRRRRWQGQTTARQTSYFVFGLCGGGGVQRVRVVRAVSPTAGGLFRVCRTTATASVRRRRDDDGTGPVTVPVFPFLVCAAASVARDDGGGGRRRQRLLLLLWTENKNKHTHVIQGSPSRGGQITTRQPRIAGWSRRRSVRRLQVVDREEWRGSPVWIRSARANDNNNISYYFNNNNIIKIRPPLTSLNVASATRVCRASGRGTARASLPPTA